jgi:MYXO-CTERM domain-containing protein
VTTAYCCANAVAVDPGIRVAASANLAGATVTLESGFQPAEDVLALPAPVGNISASYASATGVLTLSGTDTSANYQAALRSVTYADTAAVPNTSPRSITFGLGTAVAYSATGHFYQFVPGSMTWTAAQTAAAGQTYLGLQGYLATITSAGENAFLLQKASGNGWMGASTNGVNGFPRTWYWATGPEAGESFFNNTGPGAGTTNGMALPYANWSTGEPNDSGNVETVGEFYGNAGTSGFWNDLQTTSTGGISGYLCEYGGLSTDPVVVLQGSKSLVFLETAVSLQSTANPSDPGSPVTLTATVSPTPSSGTVTFTSSDGTPLGGPVTLSAGSAAVSTSALGLGTDTITASASYVIGGHNLSATSQLAQIVGLTCPSGQSACPTASPTFCTNEQTDPANCGACGMACPSGEACVSASCQAQCLSGEVLCGGNCVDPLTDEQYCGATAGGACNSTTTGPDYEGAACATGTACTSGVCAATCAAGYATCPGDGASYCANERIDSNNCGACGNSCPSGQVCDGNGHCGVTCTVGQTICSGECTDVSRDNLNCGACGAACSGGARCSSGTCTVADAGAEGSACSGENCSEAGADSGAVATDGAVDAGEPDATPSNDAAISAISASGGGCSCTMASGAAAPGAGTAFGLGAIALARRRRRSQPHAARANLRH